MKKSDKNPYADAAAQNMARANMWDISPDTASIGQLLGGVINALLAVAHEVKGLRSDLKKGQANGS